MRTNQKNAKKKTYVHILRRKEQFTTQIPSYKTPAHVGPGSYNTSQGIAKTRPSYAPFGATTKRRLEVHYVPLLCILCTAFVYELLCHVFNVVDLIWFCNGLGQPAVECCMLHVHATVLHDS